jgi:hypothetical protein
MLRHMPSKEVVVASAVLRRHVIPNCLSLWLVVAPEPELIYKLALPSRCGGASLHSVLDEALQV